MTEAALWRTYKREALKKQPASNKKQASAEWNKESMKVSEYLGSDRYQSNSKDREDEDPDCMTIDLLEEAGHRVYFGFFDLRLLEKRSSQKNCFNGVGSLSTKRKSGNDRSRHEPMETSPRPANAWYQKARGLDKSTERSANTAGSGLYHRKHRDFTTHTEFSQATDFPHTCSLYQDAKPSDSYRDTSSRPE